MADERLRLQAEVTDGFTAPLSRMETALRRTGQAAKQAGQDAAKDWAPLASGIGKVRTALEGLNPVFGAVGVGSLGAGLALGSAVTALRNFSTSTRDAALMAKELGLTTNELRAFSRVGEEVGVSASTMQGGLKNFQDELSRLRKHYGEVYIDLQANGLGELLGKMIAAPNFRQAVETAIEGLAKVTDPVKRRKIAQMLFSSDEFARVAAELGATFKKTVSETVDDIGKIGPATEQAAMRFEKNLGRMGDAWDRLKTTVLGGGLEGAFKIIDDYEKNGLGGNEQEQAMRGIINPQGSSPAANDARQRLENRRSSVQQQLELLDRNPSAPDFQRKRDRMVEELKRVADELEKLRAQGNATVQQQSFSGGFGGGGARILQAAYGGGGFGGLPGIGQGYGSGLGSGGGSGAAVPRSYGGGGGGGGGAAAGQEIALPPGGTALPGDGATGSPGVPGKYRPQRNLVDRDLSDAVVRVIAGEARMSSPGGVDAVINNMFNRLGTKGWGPSGDLQEVATAPGQYAGRRAFTAAEGKMIRDRIRAIASGGVPDNTNGSNSFRTSTYAGPWMRRFGRFGRDIGGNTFGFDPSIPNGPYGPYATPREGDAPSASSSTPSSFVDGEKNLGMSRLRNSDIEAKGSGERTGDAMMRRFYGDGAPVSKGPMTVDGKASLHIQFENAPVGMKTSASADGLFKDVNVSKRRQIAL